MDADRRKAATRLLARQAAHVDCQHSAVSFLGKRGQIRWQEQYVRSRRHQPAAQIGDGVNCERRLLVGGHREEWEELALLQQVRCQTGQPLERLWLRGVGWRRASEFLAAEQHQHVERASSNLHASDHESRRIRQQVNVRSNFVREDPFKRWLREDGEVVGVAHRRLQHDVSDGAPVLPVLRKLALDEILDRGHHVLLEECLERHRDLERGD
mmetsp:Transcript_34361/g.77939  ORF Transcript_34361/g.77939 Transcript_34361/m.77939 type:complete len:212 (+) Transcript_34361:1312-1947(+)